MTKESVKFEKGFEYVPEGDGLGVELDDDKIQKYSKEIITLE